MSVQAGVWNIQGEPADKELLFSMGKRVAEYGPDGEASYIDGSVGMLYRPFHTTLESRIERQPYVSGNGCVFTWDGRLDNRDELIPQLCNELQDDQTDLAIVVAAFDRWNTECFSRLVGDWALALWNPREKEILLARDYMGIRHLYFNVTQKRITWCTHLTGLTVSGHFTLNHEYVAGYLAFYPDVRLTPYQEIRAVPPGTFVKLRSSKTTIRTYWSFDPCLKTRYKTDREYEEHYRHLFRQAVRRRLRGDTPVLADLSGGFDSSSMVCMADDILTKEGAEVPGLDTFSYYDSNEPGEDDLVHLTTVEKKRGKTGFRIDLKGCGDSLSFENLTFEATPGFGVRSEVKVAMTELLQRGEYRVMLSGTGGDEMNGQPLDPRIMMADLLVQLRWIELSRQLVTWSLLIRKRPWIQLLFQTATQLLPGHLRARLTEQGNLDPWVDREFARKYQLSTLQILGTEGPWYVRPSARDAIQTISSLARQMAYARPSILEKRYPYLDQTLVQFLTTIPLDQLLRPGQRRSLMKRALAGLLPPEILQRKTKASSARCYSITLQKHWEKVEELFRSPVTSRLGYVDVSLIYQALVGMKNGHASADFLRLLRALCLEMWLRDAEARGILSFQSVVPFAVRQDLAESSI
jgi:asparagine synthase (glutamine-hydrolysing)